MSTDGQIDPTGVTMALAKGVRAGRYLASADADDTFIKEFQ